MSKELMIVFVYDTECCKEEADDPVNAVLYFHPSWVSDVQKLSLCGQLMGTAHFFSVCFAKPKIISLQSGKFVLKEFGRFILAVGTDRNLPSTVLEHRANLLTSLVKYFHRDIQTIYDQFTNTGQYKNISDKLYHIFETYLPILQHNGNVFQNMPISRLPKNASNIFLDAMQTLQSCQQTKGVLGGAMFYHNKVIATQLSPELTKNLILTDPYRIKSTAETISVEFHVPVGVQLLVIYVPLKEYRKLLIDSQRAQNVTAAQNTTTSSNPIIPFQFKKKMKRDKSIIFTNIPEEAIASNEQLEGAAGGASLPLVKTPKKIVPRPNHLPLRFKNITTKDIPESGFSSISFDESDSFPQFIGRTSVCSTPMTENKVLHGTVLSICATHPNETDDSKLQNNNLLGTATSSTPPPTSPAQLTKCDQFIRNDLTFVQNPFKFERRRNSLTNLQDSLKTISRHLSMRRPFGMGLANMLTKNFNEYSDSSTDDIEIDDFDRKIYRTIADPTYPVFNSDGAPISKFLFQEFLDRHQQELNNNIKSNENHTDVSQTKAKEFTLDDFDTEMKTSPVHIPEKALENVVEATTINNNEPVPKNRFALSLPLKSLTLNNDDDDDDLLDKNQRTSITNIFETPSNRSKMSGIQLTPLMTKLSILAMNDEQRSSGFSSWDTTPGPADLATPSLVDGSKVFRRRSSVKFDEIDFSTSDSVGDGMQRIELFICGQQNMTLILLLEENCGQKQELVQAMFDICVSRLTRIETQLNQILNVNVDGDKATDGGYSFLSLDPNWNTLQRNGPWSVNELTAVEAMRHDFINHSNGITDFIIRSDDSVLYGYKYGESGIFYKQTATVQNGLPPPADAMGTIPVSAKRRLERDHSIILL